jgi:hypothetical protein
MAKKKADKKTSKKDEAINKMVDAFSTPEEKPGTIPIEIEDFYNVMDPRDLINGNFTTHTEGAPSENTFTEEHLHQALEALRTPVAYGFPKFDAENASWALVTALALIKTMRVKVKERNSGAAALFGNILSMEIDFPFSFPNRMNTTTNTVVDRSSMSRDRRSVFGQRMALAEQHIHDHFKVIETWIDIAKNAKENYTVEDLLSLDNIEQRMAALRIFGAEKLIEETHAECVSKSKRGNELYKIPRERGLFDEDAYYLKYSCVSTGRIYVSGVPNWLFSLQLAAREHAVRQERDAFEPGFGTRFVTRGPQIDGRYLKRYPEKEWADLSMAWKFGLTLEEYKSLPIANEG